MGEPSALRDDASGWGRNRVAMVIVRLLLFLALATIAVAILLYVFKRDRRYLRFIWQVVKFTLIVLIGVLLLFAAERILGPFLTPFL